ncbi:ATP-binding protein [Chryseobacterium sp. 2R14A]|uniref:ATP-binding protein n=1 Tax=Chryseobacterium sp. 2R14A TaxID=3380353 RepID=UPI003CF5856A
MRTYTVKNILDRTLKILVLTGIWLDIFGKPERNGKMWIIYGEEKNGKTWFSILLAQFLSLSEKILYISAEEGLGLSFQDVCKRANLDEKNKNFQAYGYVTLEDLKAHLKRRYAPKVIFIDNVTVYVEELKNGGLQSLMKDNPDKLFIFIAHEDRGEPYTATAKMIKRLADRIVRVQGLVATVGGRTKGGQFVVDQEKAMILHGSNIIN